MSKFHLPIVAIGFSKVNEGMTVLETPAATKKNRGVS